MGANGSVGIGPGRRRGALGLYLERLRQLVGPAPRGAPSPVSPPLPEGRVVRLATRGDVFVREVPGPADRAPVLLLHGWIASADLNWYGVYQRFAGERRVIAIDHRGHGRGMRSPEPFRLVDCADDAAALLEALELPPAIVVGYSMGGPISLLLARRHPVRVRGLVLAATACTFSETLAERLRWRAIRLLELGVRLGAGDRLVRRWAFEMGRADPAFAPYASWLAAEFSRTHPRALRQAGSEIGRFSAAQWAAQLALPAAVVVTERDSLVPPLRQRSLASALAAHVERLPRGDHDVPITDPSGFSEALHRGVAAVEERLTSAAPGSHAPTPVDEAEVELGAEAVREAL